MSFFMTNLCNQTRLTDFKNEISTEPNNRLSKKILLHCLNCDFYDEMNTMIMI